MAANVAFCSSLDSLRRRARFLVAERAALLAGAAAACLALIVVALGKFHVLAISPLHPAAVILAGAAGGWAWGFWRGVTEFDVARAAEQRLSLKERISSAVTLAPLGDGAPMVAELVTDAKACLAPVRPAQVFPRHFSKAARIFLIALVVVAAAFIVPELSWFQSAMTRQERTDLRREGRALVKLARMIEKRPEAQKGAILRQVTRNMQALGKDMEKGRLTRKQALLKLGKLEKLGLQAQLNPGGVEAQKRLSEAAAEMKTAAAALEKSRQTQLAAALAKLQSAAGDEGKAGEGSKALTAEQRAALEKLASSLKSSPGQQLLGLDADLASVLAELMAKGDMQEALKILAQLAQKLQDPQTLQQMTPEELKQLAAEMRKLAEALKGSDLDEVAKQMLEMAKALERGDLKACQKGAGKCAAMCMGLGKCPGAGMALNGMAACRGGLQSGKGGVGPGDGMSQYDPNRPHDVNRQAPSRIPTQHYNTRIPGQQGDQGESYSIEIMGAPDKAGNARVPYYEVYPDYRRAAEDALSREDVPGPYRDRVKTYFDSLQSTK